MLNFFRTFFKTKIGMAVALLFLGLIALAFASADIAGTGNFGGVAGGDRVAMVGKEKIGAGDLSRAASNALDRVKQQQPTTTMAVFLDQGGLEQTLDQVIDRTAIAVFGQQHGLRAGSRLVDSEIARFPAFRGVDGKFDENAYRQMLRQQGLTEKLLRDDLAQGLLARQVLTPAVLGANAPDEFARRYSALLKESRKGAIAVLPSSAYAPAGTPDNAKVAAYYAANKMDFVRPERRVIRYLVVGDQALDAQAVTPTDAEIAARYKRDATQYAASESRSFTQLVAPTEAAARAILAEVHSGKSLGAAAADRGLVTSPLPDTTRADLARQASQAVAAAAFGAARGPVADVARGSLGWYLLQVDRITSRPERSLNQVRGEIAAALRQEKQRAAFSDLAARIEEQLDEGASLGDMAGELKLKVESTKPLVADGRVYLSASETAPDILMPVMANAFSMNEGDPQLAEVEPGKTIVVYEVGGITASAPAPLEEIRGEVTAAYLQDEGLKAAKAAASRIMAKVTKGMPLAESVRDEKAAIPQPDQLNLSRDELAQFGGRVPPALALFFSMAEGTVKRLEGPQKAGWFVVQLDQITPGTVSKDDPILASTQQELTRLAASEQEAQLLAAIRAQVKVERNEDAVKAVRRQLAGEN